MEQIRSQKNQKPELVSLFARKQGGDLDKMKDLMAEDAGAWAGILSSNRTYRYGRNGIYEPWRNQRNGC